MSFTTRVASTNTEALPLFSSDSSGKKRKKKKKKLIKEFGSEGRSLDLSAPLIK